jgi:hypothetical protein
MKAFIIIKVFKLFSTEKQVLFQISEMTKSSSNQQQVGGEITIDVSLV